MRMPGTILELIEEYNKLSKMYEPYKMTNQELLVIYLKNRDKPADTMEAALDGFRGGFVAGLLAAEDLAGVRIRRVKR